MPPNAIIPVRFGATTVGVIATAGAAGGETIVPIDVPTDGTDAAAALNAALAALPNGTPQNLTVGLLPPGMVTLVGYNSTTVGLLLSGKQWVELRGQDTTLYWPDYGPQSNGLWQRRHVVLVGCTNVTVRGVHIKGPHTARSPESNNWSLYAPSKAFQHGFQLSSCFNVNLIDCSAYEIGGDGIYLNTVDDLLVDGFRVQYNGRQGLAGIDGKRWLFQNCNVVQSARASIDWEPIGTVGTRLRWISEVEIRNSTLRGIFGVIFHRCSGQWLHNNLIGGGARLDDATTELRQLRTIRITDNDFDLWSVTTANWPVVFGGGFKELIVTDNRVARKVSNGASGLSPLVRIGDIGLNGATITVKNNIILDFVTAVSPNPSWGPTEMNTVVDANMWDLGNNDRGHGVIEQIPAWIASRLGSG